MTQSNDGLVSWDRPRFRPGGGNPHLFYKVHGTFQSAPAVSRTEHRCAGVPQGCDVQRFARGPDPGVLDMGLGDDWIGRELRRTNPELASALTMTGECLILRGEVDDPPTLDYFRDAIGLVMALLESGGTAVFDPHMFAWWSAEAWRSRVFAPGEPLPGRHVSILVSDEPEMGLRWYHTRGMLKFGRPDLSVHGVPGDLDAGVAEMVSRFIELQAMGGVIEEREEVRMRALPRGWRCRHGGNLDDPDFNNRHVEIGPE